MNFDKSFLIFLFFSIILSSFPNTQKLNLYWFRRNKRTKNFGDELSPLIIERIIKKKLIKDASKPLFLALGSILHKAKDNTTIWGTGFNGKVSEKHHTYKSLDVRAVRGPLTRNYLLNKGINCPPIYGDPALLLPRLFPELKPDPQLDYIIIPNLNEIKQVKGYKNVILPTQDCLTVIEKILQAKFVIASSLHGIIVAEAFGIPARLVRIEPVVEDIFKYKDYYYSTGRKNFQYATSIEEALQMGGEGKIKIDLQPLINSFPYEKFK